MIVVSLWAIEQSLYPHETHEGITRPSEGSGPRIGIIGLISSDIESSGFPASERLDN